MTKKKKPSLKRLSLVGLLIHVIFLNDMVEKENKWVSGIMEIQCGYKGAKWVFLV